jgi:hypothetical protein
VGNPKAIAGNAYNTDAPTFNKGRIDTWWGEFKPEHLKGFNDRFGDLLAVYDYPADNPLESMRPGCFALSSTRWLLKI